MRLPPPPHETLRVRITIHPFAYSHAQPAHSSRAMPIPLRDSKYWNETLGDNARLVSTSKWSVLPGVSATIPGLKGVRELGS